MSVATPVDVAVNPNNTDQRYILWGNGRIDAEGGAVPITDHPEWYHRIDQPVAVAFHVVDWATGAAYILDMQGGFHALNGASLITIGDSGAVSGVPYTSGHTRKYVDWSWNPAQNGQGYVLDLWGQIYAFGGATAPPRTGRRYTTPRAVALKMQWSPTKYGVQLDWNGRVFGEFGVTSVASQGEIVATQSAFRDVVVTAWSATGTKGYKLTKYGSVRSFGGATVAYGWPYNPGGDVARALAVLSPTDPIRMWEVWSGGQQYEWVASSAPTVTAGGSDPVSPASTVTDTTRPDLLWDYDDPQDDSQAAWQVMVFEQSFADSHDMDDPLDWTGSAVVAREGVDRNARGILCPVDLPDGDYRLFVRAQDTAGDWSVWDTHDWTQDVPAPATPTGLTAVADEDTFSVALSLTATTSGVADLVRFEYSDDGGTTWLPVRGATAVSIATTTEATDWDVPLGITRTYRARTYNDDPKVISAPSNTDTALIDVVTYVITAVDDSTLGGEMRVQEPVEWSRPVGGGVFLGLDADYPTVVKDGSQPKGRRSTVHVFTEDAGARQTVDALIQSRSTLVYRDPFGAVRYCELIGESPETLMPGAAERQLHDIDLPLVEVRPPQLDA